MKKILAFALLFCMIFTPQLVSAENTIHVETVRKEGKSPYFEYELNIPKFSSLNNTSFEKKLNLYYQAKIMNFKKKLEKEAKKYYDVADQQSTTLHPYIANTDYKITYKKLPLLSLYMNYYQYTGGAHGIYEWKANTFDIEEGKELLLEDLFKKESNYKDIIRQEVVRQIEKNKDHFFPDAAEQVEKAEHFKFFLEPDHLVIYFPLYEIAPYAVGIQQFRIPYTMLQNVFEEKYKKI
ncbi:DUF3298 and DUF4163 domain-containing protein [Microbacteriaceae bacterium 4G12]